MQSALLYIYEHTQSSRWKVRARQLAPLSFFASHGALLFLIFCCKWAPPRLLLLISQIKRRAGGHRRRHRLHSRRLTWFCTPPLSQRFNISCSFAADLWQGRIATHIRRAALAASVAAVAYTLGWCSCAGQETLWRLPTLIRHPGRSRKLIFHFNYLFSRRLTIRNTGLTRPL